MVFDGPDAALEGNANHETHRVDAVRALVQFGNLRDDLIKGWVDESVELNLTDGAVPADRESDGRTDDRRLGQRRVNYAIFAEVLLQAVGDPKNTTELADVLAHDEDLLVLFHSAPKTLVEGLGHGHSGGGHQ